MDFKTVFDSYQNYIKLNSYNTILTSVFVRFIVPYWGGESPKGKRSSQKDIEYALNFLKNVPTEQLIGITEKIEQVWANQETAYEHRRTFRYHLKGFLKWLDEQSSKEFNEKLFEDSKKDSQETKDKALRFYSKGQPRRDWYKPRHNNFHGGIKKTPWVLCAKDNFGNPIFPDDYINEKLESELKEFEKFRYAQGCAKGTVDKDIERVKQVLGWMHRFKNVPLKDLRITSIIPFYKLNIFMEDADYDINKYISMQFASKQKGIDTGKKVTTLIKEYIEFLNGHPRTGRAVLNAIIPLTKYIYREEVGTDEYLTEKDIPIVKQLHVLSCEIKKQHFYAKPTVPFEKKSVSWETALQVLERLRIEAETTVNVIGHPRKGTGQIDSLQDFLSVAFLTIALPLRSRVYCELEIERTLVKGAYENGHFKLEKDLADPSSALWWIRLQPSDYKTGKIYGEWEDFIHNFEFPDGKKLYEYIDKWLTVGRHFKKPCEHNYFFIGKTKGEQINSGRWRSRIVSIFDRLTGVPVSPKEFRKMYITYAKNKGMTQQEKESLAHRLQHSVNMQDSVYNQQNNIEKSAPANAFNERILKETLSKENTLIAPKFAAKSISKGEKFTRLKLSRTQAAEEIKRLRQMNMSNEQIIQFLWDTTPRARKKYREAMTELEELLN